MVLAYAGTQPPLRAQQNTSTTKLTGSCDLGNKKNCLSVSNCRSGVRDWESLAATPSPEEVARLAHCTSESAWLLGGLAQKTLALFRRMAYHISSLLAPRGLDPIRTLQFGVNVIVFALTQEGSVTNRLMNEVR